MSGYRDATLVFAHIHLSDAEPEPFFERGGVLRKGEEYRKLLEQAAAIRVPTLIAVGTKDAIAGSAEALAALIPGARSLPIPERDHMLAVGDKVFKAAVPAFLAGRP